MAHMIEANRMMFVGATPWHGLGVKLDTAPASVRAALEAAGLADWNVHIEQVQLASGQAVDSYAIVRGSDNAVLGHGVSANYHCFQNEDMGSFFDPFIEAKAATIETAGSLRGGSRVWMLARISRPDAVIVKKADDRIAKYLLLAIGHDGHVSLSVLETPVRVVCQNTLSMAERDNGGVINIRHTARAKDTLKAVQEAIEVADKSFEKTADVYRALAGKRVTVEKVRAYIEAVFPSARRPKGAPVVNGADELANLLGKPRAAKSEWEGQLEVLGAEQERKTRRIEDNIIEILEKGGRQGDLNLAGVKGTAWAAYNAVTEYLTWDRGSDPDARLNSLWLGGKSSPGPRALAGAVDTFLG